MDLLQEGENMIYVMSDLHGEYDKYKAMLDKIHFSSKDTLYVLGDVIDRGNQGIKILKDMMMRDNVHPILGNHEYMAACCLVWLKKKITLESIENLNQKQIEDLSLWFSNGGYSSLQEFQSLSQDERENVFEYILNFPLYETVQVNGKTFILVHAGLGNFKPTKKLYDYTIDEMTWDRGNPDYTYFDNPHIFVVSGHTPTPLICGKANIYQNHQRIFIDCGASYDKGKLACLCLETMQEYYVD